VGTGVFVVADGVGSLPAAGYAADRAVREALRLGQRIQRALARSRRAAERDLLKEIPSRCQALLRGDVERNRELAGMATTLTTAVVVWPHVHVVHTGDSRCYLLRGGKLVSLTSDQTIAAELAAAGALKPEEADQSPMKNVLSSSVTSGPSDVKAQSRRVDLRPGDWLLLTTDGLHGSVPSDEIVRIVREASTPASACHGLMEAARAARTPDDATVVAVHLDGRTVGG
jgi:protein phosphatase